MAYLEPLQFNWTLFIAAFVMSLTGTAAMVFTAIPRNGSIRKVGHAPRHWKNVLVGALSFSLSHTLVPLAINVPIASHFYSLHILFTLSGCFAAVYFGIRYASLPRARGDQYVKTGLAMSATILLFDYINTIFLFRDILVWRPFLVLMTTAIVASLCLTMLRLLVLSNRNREYNLYSWATRPTILLCSLGLLGIPLLCAYSVLPVDQALLDSHTVFVPFIAMLFICIVLAMIPDSLNAARLNRQNQRMIETEQHYMSLFEHNPDSVVALDQFGIITALNREAEQQLGLRFMGLHYSYLFEGKDHKRSFRHYERVLSGQSGTVELQTVNASGDQVTIWVTSLPIVVEGLVRGAYSIVKDMTRNKKAQETIRHLAYHDELTGLANRRSFQKFLEERTQSSPESPAQPFTIFFIDLDRFKRINDLFGHAFGDEVIKQSAAKLKACLPGSVTVARMGGDEFTVLAPNLSKTKNIELLASCIVNEFAHPFHVGHHTVKLSASVGIARFPADGTDAESLMKRADSAMYEAKEHGSAQYQFYDAKRDQSSLEQIMLENDLEEAIKNGQMKLLYQPKMDIRTGEITGLEALVRWQHPLLGLIPPLRFIPLAEKSGLIVPLEQWVLRTACEQIKEWQAADYPVVPIAVNISQIHLMKPDIFNSIMQTIREIGLKPQLLELEITESAMMHNEEHVIQILNELKSAGISVSMDDFGTGYSSLGYLQNLPIECLKIDRSFVQKITTDPDSRAIAEMIISMARQLKLNIVAEGVETGEQVDLLKELQCFNAQGFYYSKPIDAEAIRQKFIHLTAAMS